MLGAFAYLEQARSKYAWYRDEAEDENETDALCTPAVEFEKQELKQQLGISVGFHGAVLH
jgi:hypothetical protein